MRKAWDEESQLQIEVSFKGLAKPGYDEILDEGGDAADLRIVGRQDFQA